MKAVFFDPYMDTIGGGERYTLTLAEYLSQKGWKVDLLWNNPELKEKLESRLNFNLNRVNFISIPKNVFEKWKLGRNYNLFFWLSDGSIPLLSAKKNILHFQVPFHEVGGRSLVNQLKLKRIHSVVCNSLFTKKFIDREYGVSSKVIYPPVDLEKFKPGRKENLILSVGRFSQLLQAKRQDVLVNVFKKMCDEGLSGWKLILAGGTEIGGKEYFSQLKIQTRSYPIELLDDPNFKTLQNLYAQSKIFWTAVGFGVDENQEPEKVEHFGITTVEAMAAGCVPVVISKGGQKEIVTDDQNGLLWKSKKELITQTLKLIKNQELWRKLSQAAQKRARDFSQKRFCHEIQRLAS